MSGGFCFFQPSWVILSVRCGALLPYPFKPKILENMLKWIPLKDSRLFQIGTA